MSQLERVVVVGGSVAGLAAAAHLADRAREVVVVDRRTPVAAGSVAPQGRLPHVLLVAGGMALERLFPGFARQLLEHGAAEGGDDPRRMPCLWVASGRTRDHLSLPATDVPRALCSRPLLEERLRVAALDLPGVRECADGVTGLVVRDGAVVGVQTRDHGVIEADLVVDAGGRTSRCGEWLSAHGWKAPDTTEVTVDLRYTGYVVERRDDDFDGGAFAVVQNTPSIPRIGVALPMEGGRWQVVLGGYFGVAAPTDRAGAREFASSLTDPAIADLVGREHLQEPARYTFRSSLRRHWERLRAHPRGFCSLGDSVASFNPLYGQGMTSALLQAEALACVLDRHGLSDGFGRAISRAAADVVDNPWMTATGADFAYRGTVGHRPPGQDLVNGYVERVTRAAAVDEHVNAAFTAVQQMLAGPRTLFRPAVVSRVLRHGGPDAGVAGPRVATAA